MGRSATSGDPPPARQLLAINPYFLVDDVYKSAEHYRDVIGFRFDQVWGDPPSFVMVRRDGIQIMLRQPGKQGSSVIQPNRRRIDHCFDAYVYVRDVDTLYAELKERGANLLYEPCDQPHDCREFEVKDLDGYIICFGQDLLA